MLDLALVSGGVGAPSRGAATAPPSMPGPAFSTTSDLSVEVTPNPPGIMPAGVLVALAALAVFLLACMFGTE